MNNLTKLIELKTNYWISEEKKKSQSIISSLVKHIEKSPLREPQKEAVYVYLWLKFIGNNEKLSEIVRKGLLYDEEIAKEYENFHTFKNNFTTQFLNQFCQDNKLKNLHKKLVNDPNGEKTDWEKVLDELLHNYEYPSYLYSLPMGAGKTYLMACFIYLDLYFASFYKKDKRFAHNFVLFAPQATKTAILPSLQTIRDFNPEWVLPKDEAERIKQIIQIEILDALSSKRRDKLQGNNPNLEKVNRIAQTKNFGIVFITNAEKVVLEKFSDEDKLYLDPKSLLYDSKKALEIIKYNDLREKLSQISHLMVILDEVHHVYGKSENGEKKLRQAVNILNQHKNVVSVIGMSGTPFVKSEIIIKSEDKEEKIKLNQIQDIVYNYLLNQGIGKFLKIPEVKKSEVKAEIFIKEALTEFFKSYDLTYKNGTESKIVFYCPSIEKLNNDILPVVQDWYIKNRPKKDIEIFKFYRNTGSKSDKRFEISKDSEAIFNNLDKPYSDKRVILLVAIGTEGWDCKSLTAVALPRKETSRNFVLQTTCRCLREVENARLEKALIYLGDGNYEILNSQLKENYHLSVADLKQSYEDCINIKIRKPKLGKVKYKQISTKYKIIKKIQIDPISALKSFDFKVFKKQYKFDSSITTAAIGEDSLTKETTKTRKTAYTFEYTYNDFIYDLSKYSLGKYSEADLISRFNNPLSAIYQNIQKESDWIMSSPDITLSEIIKNIVSLIVDEIEYDSEIIKSETEIELLEWIIPSPIINLYTSSGVLNKFLPNMSRDQIRNYQRHPDDLEEDFFCTKPSGDNIDPQNISFNYIPYKMDSDFERNTLLEIVKISELTGHEVYFNGYKDSNLQSFYIQTPVGVYTPDFLILKRKSNIIEKILIVETKGKSFYDDEFIRKEKFVKDVFTKHNPNFSFICFVDEGKNDFSIHKEKFIKMVKSL